MVLNESNSVIRFRNLQKNTRNIRIGWKDPGCIQCEDGKEADTSRRDILCLNKYQFRD